MSKRKLKRQLGLVQVVMLGTAGTLAAEIFVLTGHAAARAGTDTVLAMLIGGLISYAIALNYCELATAYPVAGGAMSYVREGFGSGILSFLVGSMDCASSTFYIALSAVGFAYSLRIFIPSLPIIAVAAGIILLFVMLNILGVTRVGNIQVVLGGVLLAVFFAYVILGFVRPQGFSWDTFWAANVSFPDQRLFVRLGRLLTTIALIYNAYVGFEVIADDAEEIKDPDRTIPRGILISLSICTVIYVATSFVTMGTLPFGELAGSETALTDAASRILPGIGVPLMAIAGMVATLTSINTAMLSATREAFSLSRDGLWPKSFSRLSRFRTPYVAVVAIGLLGILVSFSQRVDFLSYISASGYLFVLFWGNLSMIRLRKRYPNLRRPFVVPLFPLTIYIAGITCLLLIAFAEPGALLFGAAALILFALAFIFRPQIGRLLSFGRGWVKTQHDCIIVAAASPSTVRSLVRMAAILAQAETDSYICVLAVTLFSKERSARSSTSKRLSHNEAALLGPAYHEAQARNVALYVKSRQAATVDQGILQELSQRENVGLLLVGWPTPLNPEKLALNPVKQVLLRAPTNVAVLLDRGLSGVGSILIPVGGGLHSRLAIRLAHEIAQSERAQVTLLRVITQDSNDDELEDSRLIVEEIVEDVLGHVPAQWFPVVAQARSVADGILEETTRVAYDLVVIGASEEWPLSQKLFGSVDDWIADKAPCSVLLCRRHESVTLSWMRRRIKAID